MNLMYGNTNFIWWVGVVEDRNDPQKLGRCRVRIFGYNVEDLKVLATEDLPWALPLQPITSAATSGVGTTPLGPVEGSWVIGWYLDGEEKQQPIMMGTFAGVPPTQAETEANKIANQAAAGLVQQTSKGNLIHDGANTPLYKSNLGIIANAIANVVSNYDIVGTHGLNANNPTNDPTKSLNNPAVNNIAGFEDPNKVYPKTDYLGKPDTNKLATGDTTAPIFAAKNKERRLSIPTALGGDNWDEPEYAYAAKYPYNHVIETEAGHIIEIDDTPNGERLHIYHKAGTYIEIDVNGSIAQKVKGDEFKIVENNDNLYVNGAYNLTIGSVSKIYIQNNADIEVDGNLNIVSHAQTTVQSAGDITVAGDNIVISGKSSIDMITNGPINIQGSDITLDAKSGAFVAKASQDAVLQSGAGSVVSINGGTELLLNGDVIKENMGAISPVVSILPTIQ